MNFRYNDINQERGYYIELIPVGSVYKDVIIKMIQFLKKKHTNFTWSNSNIAFTYDARNKYVKIEFKGLEKRLYMSFHTTNIQYVRMVDRGFKTAPNRLKRLYKAFFLLYTECELITAS